MNDEGPRIPRMSLTGLLAASICSVATGGLSRAVHP